MIIYSLLSHLYILFCVGILYFILFPLSWNYSLYDYLTTVCVCDPYFPLQLIALIITTLITTLHHKLLSMTAYNISIICFLYPPLVTLFVTPSCHSNHYSNSPELPPNLFSEILTVLQDFTVTGLLPYSEYQLSSELCPDRYSECRKNDNNQLLTLAFVGI